MTHLKFDAAGTATNERERVVGVDVNDLSAIKHKLREEREHDLKAAARQLEKEDVLDKEVSRKRLRDRKKNRKAKVSVACCAHSRPRNPMCALTHPLLH